MIRQLKFSGNPFVGIFSFTNNNITIIREDIGGHVKTIKEALQTEIILSTIAATDLAGIYIAGNNNGIILPYVIEDEELQLIEEKGINHCILDTKENAVGNLILSNDKGAIISPILKNEQKTIEDALDVETAIASLGNHKYVGSVARANNSGCIVHKEAKEDDISLIKDLLKVDVRMSTLNRGVSYIGACMIVNDKGAIVGETTTGIELSYVEDIMGV
ncbi:MAG: Translation initiation factor 6 [Candidatus Methanofastidiosum methylothiophilum]|uniref:Translation initiation factor 6 n=1 Tax=Candidatus Methanofastidiosum methylothiophilum TaxID=1705564 RepID=A0A150IVX0_9EURY|nr:MAG: Translation initiation factor 6 [Candidatus Methanofastidiosum methylthiophilus]KYC46841.1 MAG: Translation initiation factor 6 [Candidatus Methanofastidiosum methylthiophilus]KYC49015.1 MAG: Translation initiation factor 6 [Candidatus Methanofastidiosum methylthiophilus]